MKRLLSSIIGTGCLLSVFASVEAIDAGTAKLLVNSDKVITQQFSVKKEVKLPEVKVSLQLAMTVTPKKMEGVNQILHQLKTKHGRLLAVTGVSQTTSSTGLIDVTANLTVHLPINHLADIAKLTEAYTKNGQRLTVVKMAPYFSELLRQRIEDQLALALYVNAKNFQKQLNKMTSPTIYTIGAVHYIPLNVQTPRPFVMLANTARGISHAPIGMDKTLTLQADVTYVAYHQAMALPAESCGDNPNKKNSQFNAHYQHEMSVND